MYCKKCNNKLKPNWEYCSRCLEPTGFLILEQKVIEVENDNKFKTNELIYILVSIISFICSFINDGIFKISFYILFIITLIIGKIKCKDSFMLKFMFWGYIICLILKIVLIIFVFIFLFELFKGLGGN